MRMVCATKKDHLCVLFWCAYSWLFFLEQHSGNIFNHHLFPLSLRTHFRHFCLTNFSCHRCQESTTDKQQRDNNRLSRQSSGGLVWLLSNICLKLSKGMSLSELLFYFNTEKIKQLEVPGSSVWGGGESKVTSHRLGSPWGTHSHSKGGTQDQGTPRRWG